MIPSTDKFYQSPTYRCPTMKLPCEIVVTRILPTVRGALAKELVRNHGMTQVQVASMFGVTSAAISQYLKGFSEGNDIIDRSEYRDDFYAFIAKEADRVADGKDVTEALCSICHFIKDSGLLKALYILEGYTGDLSMCMECSNLAIVHPLDPFPSAR